MTKLEFGSREWLELMLTLKREEIAKDPSKGIDRVTCEVYRDAPKHLSNRDRDVVFTLAVKDGVAGLELIETPESQCDLKIVGQYDVMLPLSRLIITPDTMNEMAALMGAAVKDGTIHVFMREGVPTAGYEIHNAIAARTA